MKETKFKQTEIGMIPCDWEVKCLGDFYRVHNGLSKDKDSFGEGFPFLSFSTVFNNLFIPKKLNNLVRTTAAERDNYSIKKGDVFITRTSETVNELGMSCVSLENYPDATYNGFCKRLRPFFENNIYLMYLGFYLRSDIVRNFFSKYSTVTTRASLKNEELLAVPLVLPPFEEQQKIATALFDIDNLITTTEKLIAKKKALKQGAMQQLLSGKKRLPNFTKPWEKAKMKEGLSFQAGFPFESRFFNDNNVGMRIIRNRDLKSNRDIVFFSGSIPEDYIVKNGDILIGMDGDFLPCKWAAGPALLNQRVGRLIFKGNWCPTFFYYILYKPLVEKQDTTGATTVKHLSHNDVENMEMVIPSDPKEQTAIATVLSDMDTEIATLETKLAKYRHLKTGMMQQLLTGKIRFV